MAKIQTDEFFCGHGVCIYMTWLSGPLLFFELWHLDVVLDEDIVRHLLHFLFCRSGVVWPTDFGKNVVQNPHFEVSKDKL